MRLTGYGGRIVLLGTSDRVKCIQGDVGNAWMTVKVVTYGTCLTLSTRDTYAQHLRRVRATHLPRKQLKIQVDAEMIYNLRFPI